MGRFTKKIQKNMGDPFTLSMIFKCPKCSLEKKISRTEIDNIQKSVNSNEEWANHSAFKCNKCYTRMEPIHIVADY